MSEIVEYKVLVICLAFVAFFILERLRPKSQGVEVPLKRLVKNLLFWPLNIILSLGMILPISFAAAQLNIWVRPEWMSGLAGLAVDIIILDLFIFWWHRAVHKIPFLWCFHEVHHMDEHLDTTSAIRFHFGEIFFSTFARAILIITLAIPFSSIVVFEALVLVFVLFHHSNLALPATFEKYVSKIIITPSLHWVHHHAIRSDTDSNYGTILSIWDRIFKTKSTTKRFDGMPIGVEGLKDKTFLKLIFRPFTKFLNISLYAAMCMFLIVPNGYAQSSDLKKVRGDVLYVTPAQAQDLLLKDKDIVVLDVRLQKSIMRITSKTRS